MNQSDQQENTERKIDLINGTRVIGFTAGFGDGVVGCFGDGEIWVDGAIDGGLLFKNALWLALIEGVLRALNGALFRWFERLCKPALAPRWAKRL